MFQDRREAGQKLTQKLKHYQAEKPLILALPRGGVPVGVEIAKALNAPLDVLVVRKIGTPWNPEFGVGAIAPGVQVFDEDSLQALDIKKPLLRDIIDQETQEMNRRLHVYRHDADFPVIAGKTVILVDDGIATGLTTRAAIDSIRKLNPAKLILAVPVGPTPTVALLKKLVDDLICLETPISFHAVSLFYQSFPQVSDEEVINLLEEAKETLHKDKIK